MNIDQANAWKAAVAAQEKQRAECAAAWREEEQRRREQANAMVNHRFRHPDIAYSFRPLSYWEPPDTLLKLMLRNVKGTRRRKMILDLYEQGQLDKLVPAVAADELSDEDREWLGAIHPSLMGGEYLPGYRRDEVEIVRIELDSTTSDVISLRACSIGRTRPRIARPLTLGQLITLLDNVETDVSESEWLCHGWVLSLNESNRTLDNGDPAPYRDFTRVRSEFYPEHLLALLPRRETYLALSG